MKINLRTVCIFISLISIATINHHINAQSITFQKVINEPGISFLTSIIQTPDDGYLAVGFISSFNQIGMYIVRFNKFGDTLWTKNINKEAAVRIIKTNDNNYAICGVYGSFVKIDINGNILISGNFYDEDIGIRAMIQANDNSYYLCGEYFPFNFNPYLSKYDLNGNILWDTVYTNGIFAGKYQDVVFTADNNLVLTGYHYLQNGQPYYLFLMKTDQSGNQIWCNTLLDYSYLSPNSMIKTNNNSFVVATRHSLVKFYNSGDFQWKKNYDTLLQTNILSLTNSFDNNYVYSSWMDSVSTNYIKLRKIDTNGVQIWQQRLGFEEHNNNPFCIRSTSDSGLIVAGRTDFSNEDPYILKTNKFGNLDTIIGINNISSEIPASYKLYQNYPNPFNPVTIIKFDIPTESNVSIKIYDILGKEVYSINEYKKAGSYELSFDGTNLGSGMYFYKFSAETLQRSVYTDTKKMVLIK